MNSKLHAVCDSEGRPRTLFLTAGQVSDHTGAAALLSSLPKAKALLADKGYDADWFRDALASKDIEVCIPPKSNRKTQIPYDKVLYRKRHKIENMFGKLKDRPSPLGLNQWRSNGSTSTPATTAASTPSCPPSPSQQSSSSGYDQ